MSGSDFLSFFLLLHYTFNRDIDLPARPPACLVLDTQRVMLTRVSDIGVGLVIYATMTMAVTGVVNWCIGWVEAR
jgi:hypothetical protein